MVLQLLMSGGMWKATLSRTETRFDSLLGFLNGVSDPIEPVGQPSTIPTVRTRFNPRLIGFGIVAFPKIDLHGQDSPKQDGSKAMPSPATGSGRNSEEQE